MNMMHWLVYHDVRRTSPPGYQAMRYPAGKCTTGPGSSGSLIHLCRLVTILAPWPFFWILNPHCSPLPSCPCRHPCPLAHSSSSSLAPLAQQPCPRPVLLFVHVLLYAAFLDGDVASWPFLVGSFAALSPSLLSDATSSGCSTVTAPTELSTERASSNNSGGQM